MNMRDIRASLRRRWLLTLLGVVLTLALCGCAYKIIHPTYQATASVVVLPPAQAVQPGGNPYLGLAGLSQVVDVLSRSLSSQESIEAVTAAHPGTTYTAVQDQSTSGPILLITVDGPTAESTLAALNTVVETVPTRLASLQSSLHIAKGAEVSSSTLAVDDRPSEVRKSQIRAVIAVGVVTLALCMLAIAYIDRLVERRRRSDAVKTPSAKLPAENSDKFTQLIAHEFSGSSALTDDTGTERTFPEREVESPISEDDDGEMPQPERRRLENTTTAGG